MHLAARTAGVDVVAKTLKDAALLLRKLMQGHLMPHAAKAEPNGMLQRRVVDFHGGKGYLDLIEEEFWIGSPQAREQAPES